MERGGVEEQDPHADDRAQDEDHQRGEPGEAALLAHLHLEVEPLGRIPALFPEAARALGDPEPVRDLAVNGSYFQLDAQGRELRDAQGNPLMDEAFVAAITQFKLKQGIHQNYKLADGTFAVNEFVGPATVEALKRELTRLQQPRF